MADVAGLLASAIVTQVGAKLGSLIGDQVSMLCCFDDDMEDMKETLETIGATLEDAEKRSIKEKEVQLWLKRLKNAALDISDMIDEFQPDSKQTDGKMTGILSCLDIAPKIIMANKMKKMRDQLEKVKEDHLKFKFEPYQRNDNEYQFTDRETTSNVNKADIIGRDKERKTVIALLSNKEGATILPIFGLGGIGKTTLAQLVFNDTHFKDYFRVWVYVSQVFELRKIGNTIISQVSKQAIHSGDNMEFINRRVEEVLNDKQTLIVLDDLWETDNSKLNKLKLMLNVCSKIKVIVTTRNEEIANRISTITPCKLSPLDESLCMDIIKKNTNFESRDDKKELGEIGQVIANKCGGVPLAAQALGCMLSRKDLKQWKEVSNSDIWNEPFAENSVLPSLKLTYIAMPPYLRLCFAYCAIFPRGHIITKDNLIHQWIALDFIKPSYMFSDIQLGENYVGQLLGMSFLHHSKLPMTDKKHSGFTMHDLVYDLARVVVGEELIVYNANKLRSPADRKYCRYARVTNSSTPLIMPTNLPAKLRALLFHDCSQLDLHGGAFSFAKCLRVLDLTGSSFSKFPSSIGYLKQLRFLIAPGMKNRRFPVRIAGLSKLQYLDIHESSQILAIPESIGKLDCIMHLDLSGCTEIVHLPESFGNLKKLLHLELSSCSSLERIPESTCGLTNLQYFNLSGCLNLQRLPRDIGSLIGLQYFSISVCSKITELPVSFGKLTNLVHLDLSRCSFVITESLGGLTKLKYLNLSRSLNNKIRDAENSINFICTLTELEHLDLSGNLFSSLPECIGDLKRLHTLDLSGCRNLESLPKSIGSIDSLELLLVNECSETLKDYIRQSGLKCNPLALLVVRRNDSDYSTNLHELDGMNPTDLEISCLENVRFSEEANQIELCNKENLSKLKLHWTIDVALSREDVGRTRNDEYILGELVPPSGLKYLELHGYSSISFPKWFMGISQSLPNIANLELKDIEWCSNLPPFGQLPNLKELHLINLSSITKISEDICGGKGAFRRLSTFSLQQMARLYMWNTLYCGADGTEEFMFPVLDELVMIECPMLRLKPCQPTFQKWEITCCGQVLDSWEGRENLSHFNFSSAPRTKLLLSFHCGPIHWREKYCGRSWSLLQHLPTLQELEIYHAPYWITSLPESMRQLSSLRLLELFRCSELKVLPEWLGELKSLESISIVECAKIKTLPSSIQQLTNLQKLRIGCGRYLKQWCESDENKVKLAHIKDIIDEDCDTTYYWPYLA